MGGVNAAIRVFDHDNLISLKARVVALQSFEGFEKGFGMRLAQRHIRGGDDREETLLQAQAIQNELDFLTGRTGGNRQGNGGRKVVDKGDGRLNGGRVLFNRLEIVS